MIKELNKSVGKRGRTENKANPQTRCLLWGGGFLVVFGGVVLCNLYSFYLGLLGFFGVLWGAFSPTTSATPKKTPLRQKGEKKESKKDKEQENEGKLAVSSKNLAVRSFHWSNYLPEEV